MALHADSVALSDTLVILGAAGVVIPLFARFRITPIIGFILVGVLVGPHGLGALVERYPWLFYVTISDPESIAPFAELGIILLLFSIGLELSFRRLWAMRGLVFGLGAAELLGCAALIGLVLLAIGENPAGAAGLGLALALSSTALVLPMAGTRSPVGRAAFGMLLFEDVALVPIVFLLGALAPQAADAGFGALLRTVVLGLLTIVALMAFGRYALPRLFARAARTKSPELFLSVSLLIVILASLITTAVGLSPIVGALIAGLLIAETEYRGEVEVITAPFKGLALGVFLITIGMSVDFAMIGANWPALLGALAGVLIIKTLVTALLLRLRGAKRAVAIETGLLMASPSETTLIVLTAAMAAQVINPADAAFWQIVTAVGLTITPLLAMLGHLAARRAELRDAGAQGALVEEASPDPRAIVVGFGRVGQLVCDMLARHGKRYVAIDSDIDTVIDGRAAGFPVMFGDVARPDMLRHLELERASAVVLTMDDPVQLVALVTRIRADHPALTVVARARDADHAAQLYRAGATDTVPETLESSLQLSEAALVALGVAMGPVIASIHEKRDELRAEIMSKGELDYEPSLKPRRLRDAQAET